VQQVENTLSPGTVVHGGGRDRYIIERLLGKGGFSTIYLVRDRHVRQNLYALKEVIDPNKRERERFTFECELLMRLEHPSLPRVYRVFEESKRNRAYVLMDYIEGSNLERLRNQQPGERLALTQVIDIMAPIVDAISYLHRQNPPIVHRDIKPSNIIVPARSEEAVLVDFGIAKIYEPEATTTAVRHCSPGYGAPEQYGIGTTPRTDIYGLGATLYTLLTGTIPVDALQRMIQLNEKEPDPLVPVNQVITTIPASVSKAIARAMSTRVSARFATTGEFWEALTTGIERQASPEGLFASFYLPEKPASAAGRGQAISPTIHYDDGTPSQGKAQTSQTRKVGVIGAAVVAALLLVGLGIGIIHQSFTPQQTGSIPTQKQPVNGSTTPLSSTTSQASPPLLGQQYIGRISDLVTNTTTTMTLTQISQSAGQIRGNFSGLGLTGPFAGTIDTRDNIHFQVTIYGGTETLDFEGTIKLGGTLAGSYRVLRNQQFTGESGVWSVSP
jgi:eukaryotic-like serine/threonine-protein kinase